MQDGYIMQDGGIIQAGYFPKGITWATGVQAKGEIPFWSLQKEKSNPKLLTLFFAIVKLKIRFLS